MAAASSSALSQQVILGHPISKLTVQFLPSRWNPSVVVGFAASCQRVSRRSGAILSDVAAENRSPS